MWKKRRKFPERTISSISNASESRELINKHVSIVNAPTTKNPKETANEIIQSLKEKGSWSGEVQNLKKDGTSTWFI